VNEVPFILTVFMYLNNKKALAGQLPAIAELPPNVDAA
jgi:hypothetical protein